MEEVPLGKKKKKRKPRHKSLKRQSLILKKGAVRLAKSSLALASLGGN